MTNSEYWRMRMNAQSGSVYKRCDQFVAELMRQYQTAVRSMEADIAKWYQRFADANGITLAEAGRLLNSDELLEFQWTVEDYIRRGEENAVSGVWMKELESASARVHISRLDSLKMSLRQHVEELIGMQLKTLPEILHATYRESYDRTVYELSRGSRVMLSYQKPDVRRIDRVLGTPWSSDGKEFSERVWENRAQLIGSMNTHLTQSIIRGEDPQKAINAIAKDMGVSKRRAGTLVMTESAAIATAAQRDCYKDLDVEEFEYVCTLDEVTCPVCGAMDGKHFPMSKYEIGVNVPPMHPNCRCATAPYFEDMDDWGAERAARDENGETVSVPAGMTYEQWKQKRKEQGAKFDKQGVKFDKAYVDKQRKKAYNKSRDKEQFTRYQSVLKELAPESFEEFQKLKYDTPDQWETLQKKYRIVNMYKVDSGEMTPTEILRLDDRVITEKRNNFPSKLKHDGNIAGAYIDGDMNQMFFAHSKLQDSSRAQNVSGIVVPLKRERRFEYIDVPLGSGKMRDRTFLDSEAKLFEFFADLYEQNPFKSITMLSERGMCDSCLGVMKQFKKRYPQVKIIVVSNKKVEGVPWKFRRLKK